MKPRDNRLFLQHMLEAISTIGEYLADIDEAGFRESGLHQDAIIRQIQIIGEAAKRVCTDLSSQYPGIPWRAIAGMRDKLVHATSEWTWAWFGQQQLVTSLHLKPSWLKSSRICS